MTTTKGATEAQKPITVFHITPSENVPSIRANGIDPKRAKGKRLASWYVHGSMIEWAIGHCSARHHIPVDHLSVLSVTAPRKQFSGTAMPGVLYTAFRMVANTEVKAEDYFSNVEEVVTGKGGFTW